jgi:hypothetical protein
MKSRRTLRCMAIYLFLAVNARSQQTTGNNSAIFFQPVSFKQFPQKTACDIKSLEKLFTMQDNISLELSPACMLQGKIVSHVKPNAFAETINISLANFHGAVFTLSRIRTDDGHSKYTGHIMNFQSSDAIVLQEENKKYYFIKTEQRFVMTE